MVWEWVRDGGQFEDTPGGIQIPYMRSNNHFHDPLIEPWTNAGLNVAGFSPFKSSLIWAQDQGALASLFGGDWSWKKARDSFHKGLTGLNQEERDKNLADTFRALGQGMHLIQDVSVPAHVRNDAHVYFELPSGIKVGKYHYEVWVDKNRGDLNLNPSDNDLFDPSILGIFCESSAPIPISNIFDTNRYDGSNPNIATGRSIGLAEYTNANFFSEDTIFRNYPHPSYADTNYWSIDWKNPNTVQGEDGKFDSPIYIEKTVGEPTQHLAAVPYFVYDFSYEGIGPGDVRVFPPVLDDKVYKEYASKLIPRAVGYSAGLLKYFFRGELRVEVLLPSVNQVPSAGESGYYFWNQNETGTDIDAVAVYLQNNSKLNELIEPVGPGEMSLTIGYTDTASGSTIYQSAGKVSITEIPAAGSGYALPILFSLAQPIRNQNVKDLMYYFVFRGRLGKEEDAVIGRVVRGPVLHRVTPERGTEGTEVILTGDHLPDPADPNNIDRKVVCFDRDLTKPYILELIDRTETEIKVKVPNTAGVTKPGYGGIRVENVLEGREFIFSNPVSFFPIAEGEIRNLQGGILNATIEAVKPIFGDYDQLPLPASYTVVDSLPIQLMSGFTYHVTGWGPDKTIDISGLTPEPVDFIIEIR